MRKRAEDILAMVDKTSAEFQALGNITGGDVQIGCAESYLIKHLAQGIKEFKKQCPVSDTTFTAAIPSRYQRGWTGGCLTLQLSWNHQTSPGTITLKSRC